MDNISNYCNRIFIYIKNNLSDADLSYLLSLADIPTYSLFGKRSFLKPLKNNEFRVDKTFEKIGFFTNLSLAIKNFYSDYQDSSKEGNYRVLSYLALFYIRILERGKFGEDDIPVGALLCLLLLRFRSIFPDEIFKNFLFLACESVFIMREIGNKTEWLYFLASFGLAGGIYELNKPNYVSVLRSVYNDSGLSSFAEESLSEFDLKEKWLQHVQSKIY